MPRGGPEQLLLILKCGFVGGLVIWAGLPSLEGNHRFGLDVSHRPCASKELKGLAALDALNLVLSLIGLNSVLN